MPNWWKNISIASKLYSVVGIMALLIVGELLTLRFAMQNLSAVRSFVAGESAWSKAQKNSLFSLQRFAATRSDLDFQAFLEYLKIPDGDHRARVELFLPNPNIDIVTAGFLAGHIHVEDIPGLIHLLRGFHWNSHIASAIQVWQDADSLLAQFKEAGQAYRQAVLTRDESTAKQILTNVKTLNERFTELEEKFSDLLGVGSRWIERVVLSLLLIVVLTVETIGLTLTFLTTRNLSRGLSELTKAAQHLGRGELQYTVPQRSKDEIGELAGAINRMGSMLQKSYTELETRVKERTADLEKLASENKNFYLQAKAALVTRDEFLSVASHELKTPVTALSLQLQLLARKIGKFSRVPEVAELQESSETAVRLMLRITRLIDSLLDMNRMQLGKLQIHPEPCDLTTVCREVIAQLSPEALRKGSTISLSGESSLQGMFDVMRIEQVLVNLISNAIKYGEGLPIAVRLSRREETAVIEIKDQGEGIPAEMHSQIFERFEQLPQSTNVSGLGLGLYISRQIVLCHGGHIAVSSSNPKGSIFTVELPLHTSKVT